jgi:hypothetical protein
MPAAEPAMSKERRGPFQFLDTEWSRGVWQKWLGNIFVPPVPPHPPAAVSETAPIEAAPAAIARDPHAAPTEAPPEIEPRRQRRARLDALLERMTDIEDALDALNSRFASRQALDRRLDNADVIESMAEAAERQASAMEGLVFSIERLDERLDQMERLLARSTEQRPSRGPAKRSTPPEPEEAPAARGSRITGSWSSGELELSNGSSMHGSLSDMSLSTVMAMLELERRTGRLRVSAEDGSLCCFELRDGAVTSSRINESDIDSVDCVRQVLGWRNGRFWFRQNSADDLPRAVGSLLLEATRQNDEALAEGAR